MPLVRWWGGKRLILLAVIPVLVRCQQKPKVSMLPGLKQVFTGDLLFLHCNTTDSANAVKWYLNNEEQISTQTSWKIPAAKPNDSGSYQCESNGQKSDGLTVHVEEFLPPASLTIKTGQPVMQPNKLFRLKLEHEDGLTEWRCYVYRRGTERERRINVQPQGENDVALEFDSKLQNVPETIFWCTDKNKQRRSNQVTVRASDKEVSLEIYPLPAVVGETVTLCCLVVGTDQIRRTVFYRDDRVIAEGGSPTFKIFNVTYSYEGSYKCHATYTYRSTSGGEPYNNTSDAQDVLTASPTAALLSTDMSCSCPRCPSNASYRYYRENGQSWERLSPDGKPGGSGSYRCRAVWFNGRTVLSRAVHSGTADVGHGVILIVIAAVLLAIAVCGAALCYVRYKRRSAAGRLYEDLPLTSHYETMAKRKEDDYEALHPDEAAGGSKGGHYEALKKEGMKDGVYHTLGVGGASGEEGVAVAEGGYEALKREGMKEGVYHTLGVGGASGGEGGPEASRV